MKRLHKFNEFLGESKEEKKGGVAEIKREAISIANQMFTKPGFEKNVDDNFTYGTDGLPKSIKFEINETDYKLDYSGEELKKDYSEGVMKKREYSVSLKYSSKSAEDGKFFIKFSIKLKPTADIKSKVSDEWLVWEFESRPKKVFDYFNEEFKAKHKDNVKWDDNCLKIKSSFWKDVNKGLVKKLIEESDGIKLKSEKI